MNPPVTSTSCSNTNGNGNGEGGDSAAVKAPAPPPRVYGCVIGVQRGRTVEIFNSFELLYDSATDSLDRAFLLKKQELCRQPIPDTFSPFFVPLFWDDFRVSVVCIWNCFGWKRI
ncbi:unnamed protein product [Linum tenue]|nr:unnamed protein product [Linum tenue]